MANKTNGTKGKPQAQVAAPKVDKSRHVLLVARPGVSEDRICAEHAFDPVSANSSTALDYTKNLFPDLSLQECSMVMREDIQAVNGGDLDKLEGMLTAQAVALNAMFNNFAKRAIHATLMPQLDAYTRMALKAQSQCRTTVEAIAEIKYPRSATFIKQANIAQQQQVNNRPPDLVSNTRTGAHAPEKNITPPNELLTEASHEALDTRGTGPASRIDSKLETVGKIYRTQE